MATATALFGLPLSILEGPGLDPWEGPPGDQPLDEFQESVNPLVESEEVVDEVTLDESAAEGKDEEEEGKDEEGKEEEEGKKVTLTDFQSMPVKQLRELAKVMALSASGNKAALVERITTSLMPLGMTELPSPFSHLTPWFVQ